MAASQPRNSLLLGLDARVARLARGQHGVFSREQVAEFGATREMIRSRLRSGRWDVIFRNVFRLSGSPATWEQHLLSVLLFWGEGSVASHRGAAAVWEIPRIGRLPELTVPRTRQRSGEVPGIVHRHSLPPSDITKRKGVPLTTATRTLIDLAGVVSDEVVEIAFDDALVRKLTTIPKVRARLKEFDGSRRRGAGVLRVLMDDRELGSVPQTIFETRVLRCFMDAGLPRPTLQHEVYDAAGLVGVADFAWPAQRLIVETVGFKPHMGRKRFDRDQSRHNRLTLLAWRIMYLTWREFDTDPRACAASVRQALG